MLKKENKGSIMVEATIYIPIVICMVILLLEMALFNMQEYMMMYEAQRVSAIVSRNINYVGYKNFDMGEDNEIDFVSFPSSEQIDAYYEEYHKSISSLYREVSGVLKAAGIGKTNTSEFKRRFADAAVRCSLIAIGTVSSPEIKVDDGLFGSGVTVTFTHEIPVPKVMRYLGYQGETNLRAAAYNYAVNPSEFARNVDLAADLREFLFKKLGIEENYQKFKSKIDTVLDKIL